MNLFYGILFMSLAAILFGIEMLFFRNSRLPEWGSGFLFISICVIAVLGLGSTGLIILTIAFENMKSIGWGQWVLSATVLGATIAVLWLLQIPKKLKEYDSQKVAIFKLEPADSPIRPENGMGSKSGRLAA